MNNVEQMRKAVNPVPKVFINISLNMYLTIGLLKRAMAETKPVQCSCGHYGKPRQYYRLEPAPDRLEPNKEQLLEQFIKVLLKDGFVHHIPVEMEVVRVSCPGG
jgi:hypothetical protein